MSGNDLDRSLVSGIGWTALARWSSQAISWVAILYAARFLPVSYTHLRAHETVLDLVCRLLLEKKKRKKEKN